MSTEESKLDLIPLPKLLAAYKRLQPIIRRTNMQLSHKMSSLYNCKVYIKRVNTEPRRNTLPASIRPLILFVENSKNRGS